MKNRFSIEDYMVKYPYICNRKMKVAEAFNFLKNCNIRHLPVIEDNRVVGVVSDRDLREALHFTGKQAMLVEDVMKAEPFMVAKGTNLADVAESMASGKYGCTLVHDETGKIEGIFTTTDAMRLLAVLLRDQPEEKKHLNRLDNYSFFDHFVA